MNQNLKKSATRIAGMLGIGRITTQKDSGVVQEIQYQTPLEVASAPRLSDFGFSSGLPAGIGCAYCLSRRGPLQSCRHCL
ncbi:hypothetical protein ESCOMMO059M2_21075 [Escherichia coli]